MEVEPGERASMSLVLPPGPALVFDPVTHTTIFLDVEGEETHDRRNLSLVFSDEHAHSGTMKLAPGPVRIALDNRAKRRALPGVWLGSAEFHELMGKRRPFLTATRVFSNQTFRELYRNGTLDSEQRFTITSLTILFTDLRGSTALYDRVGDLAAYDLVRSHFGAVIAAVSAEGGAVVKTIGDAVMATFSSPERAVRAALRMRAAMHEINQSRGAEDLALNIGLHEGPCLAVVLDERQDYFGQSVNIASRVQGLADPSAILATRGDRRDAGSHEPVEGARLPHVLARVGAARRQRSADDLRNPRSAGGSGLTLNWSRTSPAHGRRRSLARGRRPPRMASARKAVLSAVKPPATSPSAEAIGARMIGVTTILSSTITASLRPTASALAASRLRMPTGSRRKSSVTA